MTQALSTLVNSSEVFAIEHAHKLVGIAKHLGVSRFHIKQIADEELSKHGNQSGMAFKARVVGSVGCIVFAALSLVFIYEGLFPQAILLAAFSFLAGLLYRFGRSETIRAAFATVILRAKVQGMSSEQISVFKDNPALRDCSDTQDMLTKIQEKKAQKSQSATPLAQ